MVWKPANKVEDAEREIFGMGKKKIIVSVYL